MTDKGGWHLLTILQGGGKTGEVSVSTVADANKAACNHIRNGGGGAIVIPVWKDGGIPHKAYSIRSVDDCKKPETKIRHRMMAEDIDEFLKVIG